MTDSLLQARQLNKCFGGLKAISNISFSIPHNCIYGIIGPNGAGKTTLFNVLTGFYPADSGELLFNGKSILNHPPEKISQSGIARTFQNIRLFGNMTVLENVMVGRHSKTHSNLLGAIIRPHSTRIEEEQIVESAQNLLAYVGLKNVSNQIANTLSYGDQRRLEIARALATEAKLLALDEPAAGMNATETQQLQSLIEKIHEDGITIMLIEHDVKFMMNLCHRILVLDHGEIIAEDVPTVVRNHPKVIEAYLGVSPP